MSTVREPIVFHEDIIVAVSTVDDGDMRLPLDKPASAENLAKWLPEVGIAAEQTIGLLINYDDSFTYDVIKEVTSQQAGVLQSVGWVAADALITREKGCALLLPTADCYPVTFYDAEHRVLALAHLGWQSTDADLAEKLVSYLKENYSIDPAKLCINIGPGIAGDSYRFADLAQLTDHRWQEHLHHGELTGIDLLSYNLAALKRAGVQPEHIEVAGINTAQADEYFSNYATKRLGSSLPDGRFMTVAMMR